jgi:protein-disulfide isomerase
MAKSSGRTAKEKAAAARAKAEATEKRRQRTINIVIGAVLVVVVGGLITGAYFASRGSSEEIVADASVPTGALGPDSEYAFGVNVAGDAPGKPVLEIWEDFQCPACGQFEQAFRPTIEKLADKGDARVIWRNTTFLDNSLPGDNSKRAANAWGCAVDADKNVQYHDAIFDNQPTTEGDGWSDDQLIAFGKNVGIDGEALTTFESCVTDLEYIQWVRNSTAEMSNNDVTSTPTLVLNGEQLEGDERSSPEALVAAIKAASSGGN